MATRVLWFSRHPITREAIKGLGLSNPEIRQVDKSIDHAKQIISDINWADMICVVCTVQLKQEFIELAKGKPVLTQKMCRVPTGRRDAKGDPQYTYQFLKWERLRKVELQKEDYIPTSMKKSMPSIDREVKLKYFAKKQARIMIDEMLATLDKELKSNGIYINKDYFLRKYAKKIDSWGVSSSKDN